MMENVSPVSLTFGQKITELLEKQPVILQLLKFAAIGFLNTGLSFVISNLISKYFGIEQGNRLGITSGVGFIFATAQSYYWNKYWAFGEQITGILKNFLRLVWVGLVGFLTLLFVYIGSQFVAPYYYYFILLLIFFAAQFALWRSFKFPPASSSESHALAFTIVSLIGFLINFLVASKFSEVVHLTSNGDLNKNLALVVATCFSLVWNFIGYKIFVFKK